MSPADQPFDTQDAILAACLHFAGVPFFEERTKDATFPVPVVNLYDEEILKKLGFTGMTIEEATKKAFESGKKGSVKYLFKRTESLEALTAAYRDEVAHIEKDEGTASQRILAHMVAAKATGHAETLLRIACVILKTRLEFMNLWKQTSPLIRIKMTGPNENFPTVGKNASGKVVQGHGVKMPGFKLVSLNLSPKHRKQMHL